MKGSGFTLKLAAVLSVASVIAALYLGSLNRRLERHQHDLTRASRDICARKAGCEAALKDIAKFEKHLNAFLTDKESEIDSLKEKIDSTRRRLGNVVRIREEYEKLEKELAQVKKVLSIIAGQAEGER